MQAIIDFFGSIIDVISTIIMLVWNTIQGGIAFIETFPSLLNYVLDAAAYVPNPIYFYAAFAITAMVLWAIRRAL